MNRFARGAFATALTVGAAIGGHEALDSITADAAYYEQQRAAAETCITNYPPTPGPVAELPVGCVTFATNLPMTNDTFVMPSKADFQHDVDQLLEEQQANDRRLRFAGLAGGAVIGLSFGTALVTGERRRHRARSKTWLARHLVGSS